jgi:hypothetical protein
VFIYFVVAGSAGQHVPQRSHNSISLNRNCVCFYALYLCSCFVFSIFVYLLFVRISFSILLDYFSIIFYAAKYLLRVSYIFITYSLTIYYLVLVAGWAE